MKHAMYLLATVVVGLICYAAGARSSHNLSPKTVENLTTAMKGEAFAYAKYTLYAEHARKKGDPKVAELFEKTAKVERFEHFAEEARLAGLVGNDASNLKAAVEGESYEVSTMYPDFARQASAAGDQQVAELFTEISNDEKQHSNDFQAALNSLTAKEVAKQ